MLRAFLPIFFTYGFIMVVKDGRHESGIRKETVALNIIP
jgi:hypothetical protein